jgi:hypothetical protein
LDAYGSRALIRHAAMAAERAEGTFDPMTFVGRDLIAMSRALSTRRRDML